MYTIFLIDMPFSNVALPSIALTQLRSVVRLRFTEQLSVQIIYLKHDFAKFLGLEFYDYLSSSVEALNADSEIGCFDKRRFRNRQTTRMRIWRAAFHKLARRGGLKTWLWKSAPSLVHSWMG